MATEPTQRRQILLVAAVGAGCIAMVAFCVIHYAPNLIKPLMAAVSGAKSSEKGNMDNLPARATNKTVSGPLSTNRTAGPAASRPVSPQPDPWHGLMVGAITLEKSGDSGLVYAVGKVQNATERQRFGVKVVLDLFDEDNKKVGSATDYAQLIDPDKEWKFKAMVTSRNAVSAKVVSVTEQ